VTAVGHLAAYRHQADHPSPRRSPVGTFGIFGPSRALTECMKLHLFFPVVMAVGILVGCSTTKSPDVSDSIRTSLDQAGLTEVSISQDRDKGVVTLGGHVASDAEKLQAAAVATNLAGAQVVSNEIAVLPLGGEEDAKMMNLALDDGIDSNLHAALINEKLDEDVNHTVKNHVVTLTGDVASQSERARAEAVAAAVPNVHQVVNELQVKEQKATSTK
jgi:hyperosmotically inducible periplasmic protein